MSLDATRWAWMQSVGMSSAKLVLLAIADRADENHRAYPGLERLASDTELNPKTIRSAIAHLEKIGAVSVLRRPGCVPIYRLIGVVGREQLRRSKGQDTPTKNGTPTEIGTPTKIGRGGLPKSAGVPLPKLVPEPTNEPTKEPTKKTRKPSTRKSSELDFSVLPDDLDPALWSDFVAMRKAMGKPVTTQTVVKGVARELNSCLDNGIDPNTAIRLTVEKGWRGVNAEWIKNAISGTSSRLSSPLKQSISDRNREVLSDWLSESEPHHSGNVIEGEFRRESK